MPGHLYSTVSTLHRESELVYQSDVLSGSGHGLPLSGIDMVRIASRLRRHADRISQDAVFLEVLDLALCAWMHRVQLQLYLNLEPEVQMCGVAEFLRSLLPEGMQLPSQHDTSDVKWAVVLTRADAAAAKTPAELNHFLPAWPAGSVTAAEEQERIMHRHKLERLSYLSVIAQSDDDVLVQSAYESLAAAEEQAHALRSLVGRLYADKKLLARDVGHDGNCGLWATVALRSGSPFMAITSDQGTRDEMTAMRAAIAAKWRSLAEDASLAEAQAWHQLLCHCVPDTVEPACPVKFEGSIRKPMKSEPGIDPLDPGELTPKRPDTAAQEAYARHTPPKLSRTQKQFMGAGLIRARPESGPSVPVKAEASAQMVHVKAEPILGDLPQASKKRGRSAVMACPKDAKDTEAKKAKSRQQQVMKSARGHLAVLGLTASEHCKAHCRKAFLKGAPDCGNGGWTQLLQELLKGKMPEGCTTCSQLLQGAKFDMQSFRASVTGLPVTHDEPPCEAEPSALVAVPVKEECPEPTDAVVPQDTAEDVIIDARRIVEEHPLLTLLPEHSMSKRYPVECRICRRKGSGKLAVFDLINPSKRRFIDQHLNGPTHLRNLQQHQQQQSRQSSGLHGSSGGSSGCQQPLPLQDGSAGEQPDPGIVPRKCEGFQVGKVSSSKLSDLEDPFKLWAAYNVLSSVQHLHDAQGTNHHYSQSMNTGSYIIRHHHCEGQSSGREDPDQPAMYSRCASLGNDRAIIRMIQRYFVKHTAAHLLAARLFEPDQVEAVIADAKASAVYSLRQSELDEVFALTSPLLQKFVRSQFMSIPPGNWSKATRDLVSSLVQPCLKVPASTWDSRVLDPTCSVRVLADKMRSGTLSTVSEVNLKLACHVASGALSHHPMVQGILVATIEQARRASRGSSNMRNPRLSDLELSMMSEAGVAMSLAASNLQLIREFGLAMSVPKLPPAQQLQHTRLFPIIDKAWSVGGELLAHRQSPCMAARC